MERDFLGMNGRESVAFVKEELKAGSKDPAFLGSSTLQWPFTNKFSTLQQFMSFKSSQEERPKKIVFDHLPSSGFHPVPDSMNAHHNKPFSLVTASQRNFNLNSSPSIHHPTIPSYPAQQMEYHHEIRTFPVSNHPYFKVHATATSNGPNSTMGHLKPQQPFGCITPVPRNVSKKSPPAVAQLTIFYGGTVNVYDNIPPEKAQAIMFLAGNSSSQSTPTSAANPRAQVPLLPPKMVTGGDGSPCSASALSSPISVASYSGGGGAQSATGSSGIDEITTAKVMNNATNNVAPARQPEQPSKLISPAHTLMPRAVPQARNASLARFLEKRKERVTKSSMPYPATMKSNEGTLSLNGAGFPEKGTEQSWYPSKPNNGIDSAKSLTKLEI